MSVFNSGDIVSINGKAMYLVITSKSFNQLGRTLAAPIQETGDCSRVQGMAVALGQPYCKVQGVVLVSGTTSLDLNALKATRVDTVAAEIIDDAKAILAAIVEG